MWASKIKAVLLKEQRLDDMFVWESWLVRVRGFIERFSSSMYCGVSPFSKLINSIPLSFLICVCIVQYTICELVAARFRLVKAETPNLHGTEYVVVSRFAWFVVAEYRLDRRHCTVTLPTLYSYVELFFRSSDDTQTHRQAFAQAVWSSIFVACCCIPASSGHENFPWQGVAFL